MRRLVAAIVALLIIAGIWLLWPQTQPVVSPAVPAVAGPPSATIAPVRGETLPALPAASNEPPAENGEARITLADPLNSPGGDIRRDLQVLQDVLIAWRTNFPHDGNPVGENADITAALTGKNSLQLALIPGNHPAINSAGELCDRWGTPFFFHQLSGERMEIRSAGPDRKFGTPDDAVLTP
jgi:hypothetical protein